MMQFDFEGTVFSLKVWALTDGVVGRWVAVDTETTEIVEGQTPTFVLGTAFAGDAVVWLLTQNNVADFFLAHRNATLVMHNAPFDLAVLAQQTGLDFDVQVRRRCGIFDTRLLFQLLRLAKEGVVPERSSLAHLAELLLNIKIEKDNAVRLTFGGFLREGVVHYDQIPERHLIYAAIDTIVTFKIFEVVFPEVDQMSPQLHLSHKIQLMGAIALDAVSKLGIGFDLDMKSKCMTEIDRMIKNGEETLMEFGYVPGTKGVKNAFDKIIDSMGCVLPRTASGYYSQTEEHLSPYRDKLPFIDAFLSYQEHKKRRTFIDKINSPRVHQKFVVLKTTGRTSSYDPNLQNLPRQNGIRECFKPAEGFVFLDLDYRTLELCTLAQVCIDLFGTSQMAELINAGVDLHSWFAAKIMKKDITSISKAERQAAKAVNFGFPGGLGSATFVAFAKQTYGVIITEGEAKSLKEQWLQAFPEMRKYLAEPLLAKHDFSSLGWCDDPEIAAGLFKRIISGKTNSASSNKPYPENTLDWAFNIVLTDVAPHFSGVSVGSEKLYRDVLLETVIGKTGRVRARTNYCQARNTPFQGLAADGAKIALYRLYRAKHRVVHFIHDEFLNEIPLACDKRQVAEEIEAIAVSSMRTVVPDVEIRVEWEITDRWYKDAKKTVNPDGSLGVYSEAFK